VAQYKSHCLLNTALFLPLFLLMAYLMKGDLLLNIPAFGLSFIGATFFLSPDLDIAHKIPLFSWRGFFSIPFRLYPRFFRHRGVSHYLIIGTLSRLVWLAAFALISFSIFTRNWPNWQLIKCFFIQHQKILLSLFLGISLADFSHILVDIISYKVK